MAWTQTDLDKLTKAVATGARRIQYGDRVIDLRRLEDLNALRREMMRDISGSVRSRRTVPKKGKGL